MKENVRDLLGFIHRSPSPYHVVRNLEEMLAKAGFTKLSEGKDYRLEKGGSYYVSRNGLPYSRVYRGLLHRQRPYR